MVRSLWANEGAEWPARTLEQLRDAVASALDYDVPSSTIRSTVYTHPNVFERCRVKGKIAYKLTSNARRGSQ